MKTGDWLPVARGAADARDVLRQKAIPALDRLYKRLERLDDVSLLLQARDAVAGALAALVCGLKGRGEYGR